MEETTWNMSHLYSPENIYRYVLTCRGQERIKSATLQAAQLQTVSPVVLPI